MSKNTTNKVSKRQKLDFSNKNGQRTLNKHLFSKTIPSSNKKIGHFNASTEISENFQSAHTLNSENLAGLNDDKPSILDKIASESKIFLKSQASKRGKNTNSDSDTSSSDSVSGDSMNEVSSENSISNEELTMNESDIFETTVNNNFIMKDKEISTRKVSISKLKQYNKYIFPLFNKEESVFAKLYLRSHGLYEFLDFFLPDVVTSLHIYNLIKLMGYEIRDAELLTMIYDFSDVESLTLDEDDMNDMVLNNFDDPFDKKHIVRIFKDFQMVVTRVLNSTLRIPTYLTPFTFVDVLRKSKNIIVLTGAGISTSLGIPDFRSSQGFYSKIKNLGLDDPQDVFNLDIFRQDPSVFYNIANMVLPPENIYSPLHSFLKLLQDKKKLLRNYTQNIDNLESYAGIKSENMIQCHGSFATASCFTCGFAIQGSKIFPNIRKQEIPLCPKCISRRRYLIAKQMKHFNGKTKSGDKSSLHSNNKSQPSSSSETSSTDSNSQTKHRNSLDDDLTEEEQEDSGNEHSTEEESSEDSDTDTDDELPIDRSYGVMKPDITFFGEALPERFHDTIKKDIEKCDLLITIGTSLKVAPVSEIVNMLPHHVPQVLINRDPVTHANFDLSLLGYCDDVAAYISKLMHWDIPHKNWKELKNTDYSSTFSESGVYNVSKEK